MRSKMFIVVKKNDVFKAVIVAIVTVFLVAMTAVGGTAEAVGFGYSLDTAL